MTEEIRSSIEAAIEDIVEFRTTNNLDNKVDKYLL